jgi:hypothetical protein
LSATSVEYLFNQQLMIGSEALAHAGIAIVAGAVRSQGFQAWWHQARMARLRGRPLPWPA